MTCWPWQISRARSLVRSHALNLLSMARLKIARSRVRAESCRRIRMAQISFSFNGGFCPVNLPLFHGTRPGALIAVVSMTFSFRMKGTLVCTGCRWSLPDPLPPSAVGKIVSALAGNSASRSIRDSRVDDDYDVTAIGRLRCIVIRNALSATASELIRSIARSIPCGRRRAFQLCALAPLVHAQGGRNADVLSVQQSGVRRGIGNAQT